MEVQFMKRTIAMILLFTVITISTSLAVESGRQEQRYEDFELNEYYLVGNTIPSVTAVVGPRKMIKETLAANSNSISIQYTYRSDSPREDLEAYLAALVDQYGCEESPKREPGQTDVRDHLVWQAYRRSSDPLYSLIVQAKLTTKGYIKTTTTGYTIDFFMIPKYSAQTYDFGNWQRPDIINQGDSRLRNSKNDDLSTDTWSSSFDNHYDKLSFLARYLVPFSEIIDAEYHIIYADNSRGRVPGPSYWDIRAALKVNAEDIPTWLDGFFEVPQGDIDLGWWDEINSDSVAWTADCAQFYQRPGSLSYLVVFADEAILLKRVTVN
jgi:hypothetical protein